MGTVSYPLITHDQTISVVKCHKIKLVYTITTKPHFNRFQCILFAQILNRNILHETAS